MPDKIRTLDAVTRTEDSVPCTQYLVPNARASLAPPSRNSNPFATCWTRPGALPFHFPSGESTATIVERLAANGWQGEIVGPHGSGKSTLLEALKPALHDAGCAVNAISLRDGQRWLPRGSLSKQVNYVWHAQSPSDGRGNNATLPRPSPGAQGRATPSTVLIIDGYEQLGWLQRMWLKLRCRRDSFGLLVTSHSPTGLPTLITLAPDLSLVQQLVATLCGRTATRVTPADVAASHAGRGSNVRDTFFDLYDQHERHRTAR
ncbi:MAG: hypothetical protein WD468_06340 [Pirellulales bacterium]